LLVLNDSDLRVFKSILMAPVPKVANQTAFLFPLIERILSAGKPFFVLNFVLDFKSGENR